MFALAHSSVVFVSQRPSIPIHDVFSTFLRPVLFLGPAFQEKLIAEHKARDMEAELDRLREEVATAEQTAAKDQGMLIRAAEERMSVLDKVCTHARHNIRMKAGSPILILFSDVAQQVSFEMRGGCFSGLAGIERPVTAAGGRAV